METVGRSRSERPKESDEHTSESSSEATVSRGFD